jgi:hypothetical protein
MKRTIEQVEAEMRAYKGKKTTKGYRQLKTELGSLRGSPSGLGDVVETITKATGIKSVVEAVSNTLGVDCGCEQRRQDWNKINIDTIKNLFKKRPIINPIKEEDYKILCNLFKDGIPNLVTREEQRQVHQVYKNLFNVTKDGTSCAPCLLGTLKELHRVYKISTI